MAAVHPSELSWMTQTLRDARARVTFWGERMIEFPLHLSLSPHNLDSFVQSFLDLSRQHSIADDLTLQERLDGLQCAHKLRNLYLTTDRIMTETSCLTPLIAWAVEFFKGLLCFHEAVVNRHLLEDRLPEDEFCSFTEEHYRQHFGEPPAMPAGNEYMMVMGQRKPKAPIEIIRARAN